MLDDAELPIIELRVVTYFGQIAADQREMVLVIDLPQIAEPFGGNRIAHLTAQRITRIGWISDKAAATNDGGRLPDQARLRIDRMNAEVLRHKDEAIT